jgi:hypothetical protein
MKRYETKRYFSETKRNGTLKKLWDRETKQNETIYLWNETERNETNQNDNVPKPCKIQNPKAVSQTCLQYELSIHAPNYYTRIFGV